LVAQLPAQARRRERPLGPQSQPHREGLAGKELAPRLALRADEIDRRDPHLAAPPLAESCAALLRVAIVGELLVVADDRVVRRAVELEPALAQEHGPLTEPLDRRRVVGDEHDRPAALLELEDLPEAL